MADRITIDLDLDSKKAEKQMASFKRNVSISIAAITAAFGVLMKKATDAASKQEDAVNRMNQSLISSGRFTQKASKEMQEFASQLQRVTIIGDEAALEMLALANTFARSNDEARKMVKAAADLSAATGVSLESAIRNLGKSFSGLTGELGESISEIRTLSAEQLKAGAAVDLVSQKFNGFAESQKRTFSGARQGVFNALGDILESIGKTSPMVISLLNKTEKALLDFNNTLAESFGNNNFTKLMLDNLIGFARAVNTFLVMPLELAVNAINRAMTVARTALFGYLSGVSSVAAFIINKFAPESELAETINNFSSLAKISLGESMNDVKSSFENAFGTETSDKISSFLERMQTEVNDSAKAVANTFQDMNVNAQASVQSFGITAQVMTTKINEFLTNGASQTIAAMGAALAKGENAFSAFAKTALNVLGDFSIQLGTMIISSALAIDALKKSILSFGGVGIAIAAGAALIAVGGALKAFSGGPESAVGAPGTSPNAPVPVAPVEDLPTPDQVVDAAPKGPSIVLNIQGNVLDRRETGLEIAEVLRETFLTNDIVLT